MINAMPCQKVHRPVIDCFLRKLASLISKRRFDIEIFDIFRRQAGIKLIEATSTNDAYLGLKAHADDLLVVSIFLDAVIGNIPDCGEFRQMFH